MEMDAILDQWRLNDPQITCNDETSVAHPASGGFHKKLCAGRFRLLKMVAKKGAGLGSRHGGLRKVKISTGPKMDILHTSRCVVTRMISLDRRIEEQNVLVAAAR